MLVFITNSLFSPLYALPDQKQLQQDIRIVYDSLAREEKKAALMRKRLRSIEKKLGEQTRKSYSLALQIKKVEKRLKKTQEEKKDLDEELEIQRKGLSQQMIALYTAGEQSHLRLLLKQDDPSDIGRTIKYFEYLNKSRIKKIKFINSTLEKVKKAEADITNNKKKLQQLHAELSIEKKASEETLKQRQLAYSKVKKNVRNSKQQLARLKRKESDLQAEIERLIAQDRTKKERKRRSNQQHATARSVINKKPSKKQQSINRRAKKELARSERQVGAQQIFIPNRKFSTLRGKLSWPVKGRIIHAYGEKRNQQQRWKGVVIAAAGGKRVKAVARGKVEFSGWFNGYGYLVIIKHDNDYRSLYGYNRAVYVRTGQIVQAGATIAAVGNSGGQQRNALYFEVRKQSSPRDPSKWCR